MVEVRHPSVVGSVRRAAVLTGVMVAGTLGVVAAAAGVAGAGVRAGGADVVAAVVGLVCALGTSAAVVCGLVRSGHALGPPDLVTLARAMLTCAVAALVADAFLDRPSVGALVTLAAVALALDAADGWVARRTGTASAFGARLDGEVDAFLILVLSVQVSTTFGGWVLAAGAARYAFAAGGWVLPWLRGRLPFRYWRKVVTATQGVVLTVAAAGVVPAGVCAAALVVALGLLAESFGRDVWWLWRRREAYRAGLAPAIGVAAAGGVRRTGPGRPGARPAVGAHPAPVGGGR